MHDRAWFDAGDREAETFLIDNATSGQFACFVTAGLRHRPVRGELIRHLLHGHWAPGSGSNWGKVQMQGVRLRGAHILGGVNLADSAIPGTGLPTLILEDCLIDGILDCDAIRIARLVVKGSTIDQIKLQEAEIEGAFDFAGAQAARRPDGSPAEAWIDARNVYINGQVIGRGAELIGPAPRPVDIAAADRFQASLWLDDADIRGSIDLRHASILGGLSMAAAHVRGNVWLDGARLTAGEFAAFNGGTARIGGNLFMRTFPNQPAFRSGGLVRLPGARIEGELYLDGAQISAAPQGCGLGTTVRGIMLDRAAIGGSLWFRNGGRIEGGQFSLPGASIKGSVDCQKLLVNCAGFGTNPRAIDATTATIGGSLRLNGLDSTGCLALDSAQIGGGMTVNGASLARRPDGLPEAETLAVSVTNARIGGSVSFGKLDGVATRSSGLIDFTGVRIAGDLTFDGCKLNGWREPVTGRLEAFKAERATVDGDVAFVDGFTAEGQVNLAASSIGGDLKCHGATFRNPNPASELGAALYAKDIRIEDDIQFFGVTASGNIRLERADVGGAVTWDDLCIGKRLNQDRAPLELQHARIGTALRATRLTFEGEDSEIDLRGARTATVETCWPAGWGGRQQAARGPKCFINLDGFVYDRVDLRSGDAPNLGLRAWCGIPYDLWQPPAHKRSDPLIDWVLHQPRPAPDRRARLESQEQFYPQPFRQLARVLRDQGDEEAARCVAIAEKFALPMENWGSKVLRFLFGHLFSFGLSRSRATVVLVIYVAIGTLGVLAATSHHMLKESLVVTAPAYMESSDGQLVRRFMHVPADRSKDVTEELDCTDTARHWTTDVVFALDMIVPFIPLHQETKCEVTPENEPGAAFWRVGKAVYSILGWVVASLWLVTFSGLLRRSEGGEG
jgi:hypothetical protein